MMMMMMMMMMMIIIIIIIAFLQHRKLLTHYRNKKITDLYNYIIIHTTTGKTDSYMNSLRFSLGLPSLNWVLT